MRELKYSRQLEIRTIQKTLTGRNDSWVVSHASELASLAVLIILAGAIAVYRYSLVASAQTLEWDSGGILTDAGYLAGMHQYAQGYDPTRPPFLPFLISVGFRLLGPSQNFAYLTSTAFYFLAMLGCYLLARQLMNPWLATMAAVSYGIAPSVFEWSSIIVSDVEAAAVASLGLATLIMATRGHNRLYLVSIPLLLLTALTQYALAAIVLAAIFYLILSKKYDTIFDSFEFYYSVGLAMLAFIVVGFQWILYPVEHHETLSVLFPSANQVNPFHSSLGSGFYLLNLPVELGGGDYGVLLVALFGLAIAFFTIRALLRRRLEANAVGWTLLAWFAIMFLYYSYGWPYDDLRYSIAFAMPAIILSFWALSILLKTIRSTASGEKRNLSKLLKALAIIFLIVSAVAFVETSAANEVLFVRPVVLESNLNTGLRQSLGWVDANVPTSDRLQSDWYTLMWWYAPQYNTTAAPLDYQLGPSSTYAAWVHTIIKNNIRYVVYVNPSDIQIPSVLQPVFKSTVGDIVVYKVVSSG